jgi:hypothetical protein
MTRSTFERLVGPWLAALLALTSAGAVGAPTARAAGCAGHSRGRSVALYADAAALLGLVDAPGVPRSPAPGEPPRRCAGAFCSGGPSAPSSALPEFWTGFDHWAMATEIPAPAAARTFAPAQDEPMLRSIFQADPIFHPPRRLATQDAP